jgi:hypothetical protein
VVVFTVKKKAGQAPPRSVKSFLRFFKIRRLALLHFELSGSPVFYLDDFFYKSVDTVRNNNYANYTHEIIHLVSPHTLHDYPYAADNCRYGCQQFQHISNSDSIPITHILIYRHIFALSMSG